MWSFLTITLIIQYTRQYSKKKKPITFHDNTQVTSFASSYQHFTLRWTKKTPRTSMPSKHESASQDSTPIPFPLCVNSSLSMKDVESHQYLSLYVPILGYLWKLPKEPSSFLSVFQSRLHSEESTKIWGIRYQSTLHTDSFISMCQLRFPIKGEVVSLKE